ncbi:MAG: transcriptional regulator domain-containing protein [Alphaproteobacteria bacterium]
MVEPQSPFVPGAPHLRDYIHVRLLTRSRVAWEYLRRNPDYQRDWRIFAPNHPRPTRMTDGTFVLQARQRVMRAEAWGLYSFRRSPEVRP